MQNPKPFLQNLVGDTVVVRLKWGTSEYHGDLMSTDSYMNLQLDNAEEIINGKSTGVLGQVLVRCNNVLWIAAKRTVEPAKGTQQNGDVDGKMEE